uniref:DUF2116 family Zn-ribbon domain-containing protein n=1 Tax=Macrostomum lignano TaxID=282301 RepID=A0A1I8FFW0_9PLAT
MPKKKTGQRKKSEKQRERQRAIRDRDVGGHAAIRGTPAAGRQKVRAFCYFCAPARCRPAPPDGKQKCLSKTGDCVIKHGANHVSGLAMVGAICDFCEAWVWSRPQMPGNSRLRLSAAATGECAECQRGVWEARRAGLPVLILRAGTCARMTSLSTRPRCQRLDSES